MFLMNLLNKVSKKLRWLRWSTVLAILFYMFFIGLILHSTTYKFQNNVKSQLHKNEQQQQQQEKPIQTQTQNRAQASEWGLAATKAEQLSKTLEMSAYKTVKIPKRKEEMELSAEPPTSSLSSAALSSALASALASLAAKATNEAAGTFSPSVQKIGRTTTTTTVKRPKWSSAAPEAVILVAASINEKHILEKAFRRADRNQDRFLSIQELGQSINRNIVEHIDEAIRLNAKEFRRVDIDPADGLITWDEYHRFFLKEHGMTEADIDEHNEIKHTALNRKAREDMMRDKARWSEAARTDLFTLTIDEYLSFRHPESSISNLLELVDDLLRQFDQDGDDQLSIEEFSEVNVADDDDLVRKSLISKTVVERKEEFKRIIDKNRDGRADRGELLNYVNPKTPRYALQEAATLFSLCDEDHNEKLSLKELLSNAEIFLTSKLIDTAHSFHTEF